MDLFSEEIDFLILIRNNFENICRILRERVESVAEGIKWYLEINATMERETEMGTASISAPFRSAPQILFTPHQIDEQINVSMDYLQQLMETFISLGSGWTVASIDSVRIKTVVYNAIGGSSYIPTPLKI